MDDPLFFTPAEIGRYWRRSESALRRSVADGALAVLRHRRRLFVTLAEVRRVERLAGGASPATARDLDTPLLTVAEAGALVRYRRSYLYELAASGEIPCVRVFGALRFRARDLESWLRPQAEALAPDALNENRTPARSPARCERNGA